MQQPKNIDLPQQFAEPFCQVFVYRVPQDRQTKLNPWAHHHLVNDTQISIYFPPPPGRPNTRTPRPPHRYATFSIHSRPCSGDPALCDGMGGPHACTRAFLPSLSCPPRPRFPDRSLPHAINDLPTNPSIPPPPVPHEVRVRVRPADAQDNRGLISHGAPTKDDGWGWARVERTERERR